LCLATTASIAVPANGNAKDNSQAQDNSNPFANKDIVKVEFIHYAKSVNHAKPIPPVTDPCYKLMGVKWSSLPVKYNINPINQEGLSQAFVLSTISSAAETWDAATSKELFNNAYNVDTTAAYGVRDSKNSIVFGNYSNNAVIAVTSVWYSTKTKQIQEFDMLFNNYYNWGDASINPSDASVMDLQDIATHELGHSIGLDDIYTSTCSAVTMYGYGTGGETQKRTLEPSDITGLRKIYGN